MITNFKYLDNCYITEFDAIVTSVADNFVVLDNTYFYPQGGGQPGDTGIISNIKIINTKKDEKYIYHFFEQESILKVGMLVHCQIDWERRYNLMRTHSASHLVEYFLFQKFGKLDTEGSYITEKKDKSTYITDISFTPESLQEVEDKTNAFITENHEIVLSANNENPNVRYWTCENIVYKCGGTHPHYTSEIGHITIKRKSGGKGKQRIITEIS